MYARVGGALVRGAGAHGYVTGAERRPTCRFRPDTMRRFEASACPCEASISWSMSTTAHCLVYASEWMSASTKSCSDLPCFCAFTHLESGSAQKWGCSVSHDMGSLVGDRIHRFWKCSWKGGVKKKLQL